MKKRHISKTAPKADYGKLKKKHEWTREVVERLWTCSTFFFGGRNFAKWWMSFSQIGEILGFFEILSCQFLKQKSKKIINITRFYHQFEQVAKNREGCFIFLISYFFYCQIILWVIPTWATSQNLEIQILM
jgi:hypothetical protein